MIKHIKTNYSVSQSFKPVFSRIKNGRYRVAVMTIFTALVCCTGPSFANVSPNSIVEKDVSVQSQKTSAGLAEEDTIDINAASVLDIASMLPGIGLQKAQRIVNWRNTNGPFQFKQQLLQVNGIGEKTLERITQYFRIGNHSIPVQRTDSILESKDDKSAVLGGIVSRAEKDAIQALQGETKGN